MLMLEIISFLVLGLAVGTFGTLVGIGGGIFLVPIFLLILHWSPQHAVGTSLAVVFLNALSGSFAYVKQKRVYYNAAIWFSLAALPGAFAGSFLVQYFSGYCFRIAFGSLLLIIAALMYYRSAIASKHAEFDKSTFTYNRPLGIAISFVVGFLSSILGIGGGVIHVPAMVFLLAFPAHIATATSHFVLAISSFMGFASHLSLHNVLLVPAAAIGIGAVIGAQLGAKISYRVTSQSIIMLLALSLAGLGLRLIFTATSF